MKPRLSLPSIHELAIQRAHGDGEDAIAALRGQYEAREELLRPYSAHSSDWAEHGKPFDAPAEDSAGLCGVPVSVKDLFGVPGFATFAGSPTRLPPEFEDSGPVVRTLQRLGAAITGKTHTVEFAFGGLGINPHWPAPANPWDTTRVPGGSSTGAGVSLYCDARLALGTDTAGSVRIPASMTGVVGLKTSYGRWPMAGIVPLSPSLDSVGLLGHTVADVRYAFTAIDRGLGRKPTEDSGDVPGLFALRFGIADEFFWSGCDTGVTEAVRTVVTELEQAGVRSVPTKLPETRHALEIFKLGGLAAPELFKFLTTRLPSWYPTLDPNVAARMQDSASTTACEYLRRQRFLGDLSRLADARLANIDVLLAPTVAVSPPRFEDVLDMDVHRQINMRTLRNTTVVNLLGLCAISLPAGLDEEGMPVGLQLIGRHGCDYRLLAVAEAVERQIGTARERLGLPHALRQAAS